MQIILGSDHGGFEMKEKIKTKLSIDNIETIDVGALEFVDGDDYVDYAKMGAEKMSDKETRLILFCRNGFGMNIVANRYKNIRCGVAFDVEAVRKGRIDDDINALSIPSDYFDAEVVWQMIKTFLETEFSESERYERRLNKLISI